MTAVSTLVFLSAIATVIGLQLTCAASGPLSTLTRCALWAWGASCSAVTYPGDARPLAAPLHSVHHL